MPEWIETLPWWSVLAVYAVCFIGCVLWTRREARRLDAAGPDAIDTRAELIAADSTATFVILAMCCAYMLLPNPWPGTIRSIILSLAMSGLVTATFFPVRRRAAKIEAETSADLVAALGKDLAMTALLFASVLLSVSVLSWAGLLAVSRHLLSPQSAAFLVLLGVCASYGTALFLDLVLAPWLIVGRSREGGVKEGVLFDMAEAAFRRAGLPAPDVFLVDGRFMGGHVVGYCGLQGSPVKPILLVEARLLAHATVRELSAVLRHEVSHAARNHLARTFLWRWLLFVLPGASAWLTSVAVARYLSPDFSLMAAILAFGWTFPAPLLFAHHLAHRQEMDADADAVLLYGAELQAMLDGLARIENLNGGPLKLKFWQASTHPDREKRTSELMRRVALNAR